MHILMVTARYPPFMGGTEAHVADVGRRLVELGFQVTVLTTVPMPSELNRSVEGGVDIIRVPAHHLWSDVYLARHLARHVTEIAPDVVHVQGYHTFVAPVAMWAARRAHIPYVVTFHSGGHDSRVRRIARPVQRRLLRGLLADAQRLIAVSEFEQQAFARSLRVAPSSIEVIPTGVADAFAEVDRPELDGPPSIISIGRLVEYKGHHLVIEALPEVRKSVPSARLRVFGDGEWRSVLEDLVVRNGLKDAVEFAFVPAEDRTALAREIASARVAVFMSSYESQGIAGYEAVATGTRAVIAEGTALDELARYPGVHLIPRDDPAALVSALVGQLTARPLAQRPPVPRTSTTGAELAALYSEVLHG